MTKISLARRAASIFLRCCALDSCTRRQEVTSRAITIRTSLSIAVGSDSPENSPPSSYLHCRGDSDASTA